ncbi:MAG: molybdopterin-dependent oxidoreductase [Chloroflexi bacterium]|nr:molybdopterin-dependent oxidoreductase [Chloroflexota bacterium]
MIATSQPEMLLGESIRTDIKCLGVFLPRSAPFYPMAAALAPGERPHRFVIEPRCPLLFLATPGTAESFAVRPPYRANGGLDHSFEAITVVAIDTDVVPYEGGTSSSRTTFAVGGSVTRAASDLHEQRSSSTARLLTPQVSTRASCPSPRSASCGRSRRRRTVNDDVRAARARVGGRGDEPPGPAWRRGPDHRRGHGPRHHAEEPIDLSRLRREPRQAGRAALYPRRDRRDTADRRPDDDS